MTVADVAFGDARAPRDPPPLPRWITAAFALALAAFGIVSAVHVFAGTGTYADVMGTRDESDLPPNERAVTFPLEGGGTWTVGRSGLDQLHERTLAYVLREADALPTAPDGRALFDERERSHMADVRGLFGGVRIAWVISAVVLLAIGIGAGRRGSATLYRLARDASVGAGAAVLVLAVAFAVAFEPAFLLFHRVFFPQGNFLFDPSTSNLLRLYPERYWYGVTLRVGLSFLIGAAALAGVAHLALRRRAAR